MKSVKSTTDMVHLS